MKILILFVMVHLVGATLNAQTDSVIHGKWDVCVNMELNLEEDCSENSYVTYDFHENGTYSDNREYIIMGVEYKYHGKWSYDGTVLIIDTEDENGMTIPPQEYKMTWVNENLFYIQGTEGRGGPTVYTYFKRQ